MAGKLVILLLGLSTLLGAAAVNPCLDPSDADYGCMINEYGNVVLSMCSIADEDVDSGDLASCFDATGREEMENLYMTENNLTTLPEGIFENMTALTFLTVKGNNLTVLPENIFQDLPALTSLFLYDNALTALPETIFQDNPALNLLSLYENSLTTLPEGVFHDSPVLSSLFLDTNALNILPEGVFQDLISLRTLSLSDNTLTTLPESLFQDLLDLTSLNLTGNDLECLPATILNEVDDDATYGENGLYVGAYGSLCGCAIANVTDNVCGQTTCTAGSEGFTCAASNGSTPAPSTGFTLPPSTGSTLPPSMGSTLTPSTGFTPAPSPDISPISSTESPTAEQNSPSDSNPIVVGVASAVAGAAVIALAVLVKVRRASKKKATDAATPSEVNGDVNLEQGRGHLPDAPPPSYSAMLALGNAEKPTRSHQHVTPPHRDNPTETDRGDVGNIVPPPPPATFDGRRQPSFDRWACPDVHHTADFSAERLTTDGSAASAAPTNVSTAGREEFAQFHRMRGVGDAPPEADVPKSRAALVRGPGAAPTTTRQTSDGDIGLGHAVLMAAQELAHHCQVPGISEAAAAVCIMANLVTDCRENDRANESRLRQCRSILMALKRAAKVAEKGGDTIGEAARVLIEDVQEAIFDLVELVKTFQTKNKLSRLFMSTLFKRRQEELDAVVDRAIMRLQLGLQLQVGHDVSTVKDGVDAVEDDVRAVRDDVSAVKDDVSAVKEAIHLYKGSVEESTSQSVAEARSIRRQRKLDQVEIPEDYVSITTDLLGKGGFGEVYLADYNGHNAAAKVLYIAHDVGALDEEQEQRETAQRRAFLRELEAMIRLRSPNTVNVYGAVTSFPDRMVLVMELLSGGDLLTLLRKSKKPLPEDQSRRIIGDICTGMAFLHSKNTVHGDLKSANVLLDGGGRAKIADFGTSRWSQHGNSTGLATYTTKSSQSTQMSIAWSAPEVLDAERSTYKSDVYSFGIVVWEVISREVPWAKKTRPSEILTAVLRGIRPSFHVDAPPDIVEIAKASWSAKPEERTTFRAILDGMKANGWHDDAA